MNIYRFFAHDSRWPDDALVDTGIIVLSGYKMAQVRCRNKQDKNCLKMFPSKIWFAVQLIDFDSHFSRSVIGYWHHNVVCLSVSPSAKLCMQCS